MTRALALVLCGLLPGCTLGFGGASVGRWRAHREVESRVCVEAADGSCAQTSEVGTRVEARRFHGFTAGWELGAATSKVAGQARKITPSAGGELEYLRGRGALAYGLRVGLMAGGQSVAAPVMAMGHWGTRSFSLHAGLGYDAYASVRLNGQVHQSHDTAHGLAGLDLVLNDNTATQILLRADVNALVGSVAGHSYATLAALLSLGLVW